MTTKPTASHTNPEIPRTDGFPAAYAEMAADSERKAEAPEWLEALPPEPTAGRGVMAGRTATKETTTAPVSRLDRSIGQ